MERKPTFILVDLIYLRTRQRSNSLVFTSQNKTRKVFSVNYWRGNSTHHQVKDKEKKDNTHSDDCRRSRHSLPAPTTTRHG